MKQTAFYAIHQRLGAKIVEFGGYQMPVQYSGIIDEHKCVRNAVGMFDVSHMGEFEIRGKDAMKQTAFYAIHQRLGAKIVEFGGYQMPVQYSGIIDEHKCVRNAVGMFDVSHMGEFEIRGKD